MSITEHDLIGTEKSEAERKAILAQLQKIHNEFSLLDTILNNTQNYQNPFMDKCLTETKLYFYASVDIVNKNIKKSKCEKNGNLII